MFRTLETLLVSMLRESSTFIYIAEAGTPSPVNSCIPGSQVSLGTHWSLRSWSRAVGEEGGDPVSSDGEIEAREALAEFQLLMDQKGNDASRGFDHFQLLFQRLLI